MVFYFTPFLAALSKSRRNAIENIVDAGPGSGPYAQTHGQQFMMVWQDIGNRLPSNQPLTYSNHLLYIPHEVADFRREGGPSAGDPCEGRRAAMTMFVGLIQASRSQYLRESSWSPGFGLPRLQRKTARREGLAPRRSAR
jgi:hypothetical protein